MNTKERDRFVAVLATRTTFQPHVVSDTARLLMRNARSHRRIMEAQCNGHPAMSNPNIDIKLAQRLQEQHEAWCAKREAQLEKRISELAKSIGCQATFTGDPRGPTARIIDAYGYEYGIPS